MHLKRKLRQTTKGEWFGNFSPCEIMILGVEKGGYLKHTISEDGKKIVVEKWVD